jgi:DNA-directed RNA polymerase specialized sigma24 family protein
MSQESEGLSFDLEWIIYSGQDDPDMLVEALVNEHYIPVYRLSLAMLEEDPRAAHQAAMQSIVSALLNIPRNRGSIQVDVWLYDLAQKVINRFEQGSASPIAPIGETFEAARFAPQESETSAKLLEIFETYGRKERYALIYYYLLGWVPRKIAAVLRVSEHAVLTQLELSRAEFRELPGIASAVTPAPLGLSAEQILIREQTQIDRRVSGIFQAQFPAPELSEADWERVKEQIISFAAESSTRKTGLTRFGLAAVILVAVLIIICLVSGAALVQSGLISPEMAIFSQAGQTTALQPTVSPEPLFPPEGEQQDYLYIVQPGDSLETISQELNLPQEKLSEWNDIDAYTLLIPGQALRIVPFATTTSPPTPVPNAPSAERLGQNADSASISHRLEISASLWRNLWIDSQVVDYGPVSYLGPPRIYHAQAWVAQPAQSLELYGLLGENPSSVYLVSGGVRYVHSPEWSIPRIVPWEQENDPLLLNERLRQMVFPHTAPWVRQEGHLDSVGREQIAGRETLIVDWFSVIGERRARLWLDNITGIALRIQEYGGPGYETLIAESMATEVIYNLEIPAETLFDPHAIQNQNYATLEEDGETSDQLALSLVARTHLPLDPAPVGFDPADSWLHFQFNEVAGNRPASDGAPAGPVELLADGYYLGPVKIYPPWGLRCTRSPDGQRLAYNLTSDGVFPPDSTLRWLNLEEPGTIYEPLPGFEAEAFAFSPDGRQLAVFGHQPEESFSGVKIIEIGTGESWPLISLHHAGSLAWSPDGAYLALVGQKIGIPGSYLMIIRVALEEVIFERPVQLSGSTQTFSWSALTWGVEFPLPMGNMGTCAQPPDG